MAAVNPAIEKASVLPGFEHISLLARRDPDVSLAMALQAFAEK